MEETSAINNQRSPRIVFMGTPEFAVASLNALVKAGYQIVGVVTAADKPAGRGLKLSESAVKKYAREQNLNLLTPEKLKNPGFLEALQQLNADLQVVVAFRMLPEVVWNMPPMGTINLHGSLLPQYRGAAPINWAIINGEKETGVTTFKLQHEIDTGNVLLQESMAIEDDETASDVHDRMKEMGASLLVKTLNGLVEGTLNEKTQHQFNVDERTIHHAPKIFKEDCRINWRKSIDDIYNLIRGLSSYPASFTELNGKTLKIFKAEKQKTMTELPPGEIETDNKTFLRFTANDGVISLKEVQLEGKKKMMIDEFLRGYRLT
ncbi:MAG: methionyl-tRNA formyltransferase [Chitinophagaceae bacterium]